MYVSILFFYNVLYYNISIRAAKGRIDQQKAPRTHILGVVISVCDLIIGTLKI